MSFATIEVPSEYGYVLLSCLMGQFVVSSVMGGKVMTARDNLKVPYPHLYATPGHHDKADDFNRIQRGHQSYFETLTTFTGMCLVGGVQNPLLATGSAVMYHLGSYFYQVGYGDNTLDVKMARYKRGGMLKWIGFMLAAGLSVKTSGSIIGWW